MIERQQLKDDSPRIKGDKLSGSELVKFSLLLLLEDMFVNIPLPVLTTQTLCKEVQELFFE